MTDQDFIIIGGGIAGLSACYHLAAHGRVCLFEREDMLGAHSSGRNAAIYRPLESDSTTGWLSRRSTDIWKEIVDQPILQKNGLLLVSAEQADIRELACRARGQNIAHRAFFESTALYRLAPSLASGQTRSGILVNDGGVLDIHAMLTALESGAKKRGAQIRLGACVDGILSVNGHTQGVQLSDGRSVTAPRVIIAAGAWAALLGRSCGAPLDLTPLRRHLVQLNPAIPIRHDHPIVWRLEQEVYFRPESGGILASPCDEELSDPREPATDPRALESLATKLSSLAPALANSSVRRSWACLRTFSRDREVIAGADPRVKGLYWLGALGGRGMSIALATGEIISNIATGREHPLADPLSPARLLD
jgi:D-arginine dehydrogenase